MKFKCSCGYVSCNVSCFFLLKKRIKKEGGKLEYDSINGGMKGKCPSCKNEINMKEGLEII